ncbi:hypothetical protein VKT23_003927 [Stygiomarasmius scandens]|uniref:Uncharacterized protein n=1 Tax=Marasmiellus scandens TaxID=2682957 RepID=A0ABR1JYE7_9AGAR
MSDVQHQKPDPIESNARLFGHYTAKFSNLNQFVPFAKKFSDWLNDHRAYYELARPEIVKILEHAKKTLQNSDVHLHESPYFSAYQSMVIAAWTHRARFIESELCERLEALHSGLNFVNANQAHSPSPTVSAVDVMPKVL